MAFTFMQKRLFKWLKIAIITIVSLILLVAAAGIYRFNFTNDDMYIETDDGRVIPFNETLSK